MLHLLSLIAITISITLNFILLDIRDTNKLSNTINQQIISKQSEQLALLKEQINLYKVEIKIYQKLKQIKDDL